MGGPIKKRIISRCVRRTGHLEFVADDDQKASTHLQQLFYSEGMVKEATSSPYLMSEGIPFWVQWKGCRKNPSPTELFRYTEDGLVSVKHWKDKQRAAS